MFEDYDKIKENEKYSQNYKDSLLKEYVSSHSLIVECLVQIRTKRMQSRSK